MPAPYSVGLRARVLAACDECEGTRGEIAKRFRISSGARRGASNPSRTRAAASPASRQSAWNDWSRSSPIARLRSWRAAIETRPVAISAKAGCRVYSSVVESNERNDLAGCRPDIAHERARFQKRIKSLDASKLVFLNESGAATNMVCTYGAHLRQSMRGRTRVWHSSGGAP